MKDKPNEWVSIADLMSGVMAVVMLMLVVSVLQKTYADIKHQEELSGGTATRRQELRRMLSELQDSFSRQGADGLASFNLEEGRITLRDGVFGRGSACITHEARAALASVEAKVKAFLVEVEGSQIFVEGHTDNLPVARPVTDFERFCTVYDDNYTLSAARAREARRLIAGAVDAETSRRIVVAGYGDSHPLSGVAPGDARNRRVDVRFELPKAEGQPR